MNSREITLPELGLLASTRALFGAGVGLLIADRFAPEQRRSVGWTLIAVGALTTIPLVVGILLSRERPSLSGEWSESTAGEEVAASV